MTKTKTLIFTVIAAVLYAGNELLKPEYQGDGFGELAKGLEYIFIGVLIIPLAFGIISFIFSKERRFVQALISFGISFGVMLVFMLAVGAWKNMERERLYPSTEVETLPADSPERKR